jgi:molecular chaperone GrpE
MPASEETGSGPVIRDRRRIDPVTGQVRGKHAASKPAGTRGAGRPGQEPGQEPEAAEGAGPTGPSRSAKSAGSQEDQDAQKTQQYPEEVPEVVSEEAVTDGTQQTAAQDGKQAADLEAQLAERTADLQRLQAEYANYRKRVDRDRATVREHAVAGALTELLPVLDAISQAREHGELSGGFKSVADALQAGVGKLGLVTYGQRGDAFDPKIHEALSYTDSPDVAEDTCVEIYQPGYKVGERILRPARVAVAAPTTGPDEGSNAAEWPSGEENS